MAAKKRLGTLIGKNVEMHRRRLGLVQKQLSAKVGYADHSQIAKIESGTTLPHLDKALALAHCFNITLDALVGESKMPAQATEAAGIVRNLPEELQYATVDFLRRLHTYLEQQEKS